MKRKPMKRTTSRQALASRLSQTALARRGVKSAKRAVSTVWFPVWKLKFWDEWRTIPEYSIDYEDRQGAVSAAKGMYEQDLASEQKAFDNSLNNLTEDEFEEFGHVELLNEWYGSPKLSVDPEFGTVEELGVIENPFQEESEIQWYGVAQMNYDPTTDKYSIVNQRSTTSHRLANRSHSVRRLVNSRRNQRPSPARRQKAKRDLWSSGGPANGSFVYIPSLGVSATVIKKVGDSVTVQVHDDPTLLKEFLSPI